MIIQMNEVIKISFKNFLKNRKKTVFICIAVFISLYMLLMSNAFVNGMQKQITNAYINIQSGDVAVMWRDHYDVSTILPGKFVNPNTTKTFDVTEVKDNEEAINILDQYLKENANDIDFYSKIVRRTAKFVTDEESYSVIVYGLEDQDMKQMEKTNTLTLESGEWAVADNEVVISRQRADDCQLKIGDEIQIRGNDVNNKEVLKSYKISGIYTNGAEYNNFYAVMSPKSARTLFDMDDDMFDMVKVFLKNSDQAESFANKLDDKLLDASEVLRAQDYYNAGLFFTALSPTLKIIYQCFVVVLLLIISVGLRAVIRLNIHSSMKEFGTMRAVGFSKIKCFGIIFFELLFASVVSLALALMSVMTFVIGFGERGLYIGTNMMTNAFGGEYLYFILKPTDYVFAVVVMLVFVLISTIPPTVKMVNTKITDLLNKPRLDG